LAQVSWLFSWLSFALAMLRVSASGLLVSVPLVAAGLVYVPIQRHVRPKDTAAASQPTLLSAAQLQNFAQEPGIEEIVQKPGIEEIVQKNLWNIAYYGEIQVGTPGQAMNVIFDTGSSSVWLPTGGGVPGSPHHFFQAHQSSTYEELDKPFTIRYGDGPVSGHYCRESLALGDLELQNFTFATVEDTSTLRNYRDQPFDGILGLGFRSPSRNDVPTFMEALVASGQLAEPIFGFFLGTDQPGQLVLGGVDPEHYVGSFHFVDLLPSKYWQVALDGVRLGADMALTSTARVIIDSGTSLLSGPDREVRAIAAMIGATRDGSGQYMVRCSDPKASILMPSLAFVLGGRPFSLSFEELIVDRSGDWCALGLSGGGPRASQWILGDVFMRQFYVQFDWGRKRLGLAVSSARASAQNNLV